LRNVYFIIASIQPSDVLVAFLKSIENILPEANDKGVVRLIISCSYSEEQLDSFYASTKNLGLNSTLILHREDKGLLARFNRALETLDDLNDDDILLFCNDDLLLDEGFVKQLFSLPSKGYLAGPMARGVDGHVQISIYRKKFTPWLLFWRLYDGGLYSIFLNKERLRKMDINLDRETVDGCCFILPGNVIKQIGGRFDDSIYLYGEEIYLQYLVRSYNLKCFVDHKLTLIHSGGATLTNNWTVWRSKVQRKSRLYAAKRYMNCNTFVIALIYIHATTEMGIRRSLNILLRR